MTDYFKKTLLEWVTGNYTYESPKSGLVYSTNKQSSNTLQTQLNAEFTSGYTITVTFQPVDTKNQGIGYTILCGYDNSNNRGFIAILDTSFNLVTILKQYTSGVNFGKFLAMNVDEKGQYFAIENQTNGVKRLVLLNNITATTNGEFKANIRTAYNLNTQSSNMKITGILKAENTGKYLIYGYNIITGNNVQATEFTINVGAENEWVDYDNTLDNFTVKDCWANWDADNKLTFALVGIGFEDNKYKLGYAYSQEDSLLIQVDYYDVGIKSLGEFNLTACIINQYEAYYGFHDYLADIRNNTVIMYLNRELDKIYTVYNKSTTQYDLREGVEFKKIQNEVMVYVKQFENVLLTHRVGRIYNTYDISLSDIFRYNYAIDGLNLFMVTKQFNLYNFYVQTEDYINTRYQIFNENDYNGLPYNGVEPIYPNSARLYNNGIVVFARNLYNINRNGNVTTSTLEVPNTFLNEIPIFPHELWSKTNQIMVQNTDSITTNIYETLLINFINTINMRNENDINNVIVNNVGASALNSGLAYSVNQTRLEVLRINYQDGTVLENSLNPTKIDDTHYNYTFTIYVSKLIKNIQFLTNYKMGSGTVYLELDGANYELNKAYKLSQNVRVE